MSDAATDLEEDVGPPEDASGKMSFLDHLDELRRRLVRVVTYIGVGLAASFYFSADIYHFLSLPMARALPGGAKLAYTNPTEPLTVYIKVSFLAAIFLTIPLTLYEIWKFIAPGLYRREKRYVVPFLFSSVLLFVSGGAFCYYVVLPQTFGFLLKIGAEFQPVIKIDEYLALTNMMILGFGLVFEMPVIVAFLALFGLVSGKFLWNKFRYALMGIVALAAVLSPTGDAFSLLIWAAPMVVLYILSIGIAFIFGWRRRKAEQRAGVADAD